MGNSKVLVTGGCGFIGRHLTERLVEMGKDVTVLDILAPQTKHISGYKTVKGDICNNRLVDVCMEEVDTVYHLAAVTTFHECHGDPLKAVNVNVFGTSTILKKAREHKVRNLVYFSSASVYSGNKELVKHEEMTLEPQSMYGITKLMGEDLCRCIERNSRLACTILRPFNVYGAGGRGVINRFATSVQSNGRITIYGDGSQTRDYIHVDDIVEIATLAGERGLSGSYNAGTGGRCNLLELKGIMERVSGKHLAVNWQPREAWDLQELIADTEKVKEILPTAIPLKDGIKSLLEQSRC